MVVLIIIITIVDRFATLKWSDDGCSTTITNILTFLPDAEKPAATGGFEEKGTSSETRRHLHIVVVIISLA
jgi:hypothetical protein